MRRFVTLLFVLAAVCGVGCAGPAKLAEKSEDKLAEGDVWKAWDLATKALDKAPGNQRARGAAAAAATAISRDWQRQIAARAGVDSLEAAEEVLKFAQFRADAIPYTTVRLEDSWMQGESRLRQFAARTHYADGVSSANSNRPKKAYGHFQDVMRFLPSYKDASLRAAVAYEAAQTRVAIVPLRTSAGNEGMGRDVAAAWSDELLESLSAEETFTRVLTPEDVERHMKLRELGKSTRADAVRIGERADADRVVWGTIGAIDSQTGVQYFRRNVWHRTIVRDETGRSVSRWVEFPLHVIARTRTVSVDLAYEVISTKSGSTLTRESGTRGLAARAVWTAHLPEGESDSYVLVTDEFRSANPERAKQIEADWRKVVGPNTTLSQVIEAKRVSQRRPMERADVLARYASGASFVLIEELPSAQELAQSALVASWKSVRGSLVDLDDVDDVDTRAISVSDPRE